MASLDSSTFCPKLFNGLYINMIGEVSSCCVMTEPLGDLRTESYSEIINNDRHKQIKQDSLNSIKNPACSVCWKAEEQSNTAEFSPRINALEYASDWMNKPSAFRLETLDLRWQNTCNYACIMCSPIFSSKWEKEKNIKRVTDPALADNILTYQIFEIAPSLYTEIHNNAKHIKEIYLAGGEPLQMKENVPLLKRFLKINPDVKIRLNTNLSVINTEVYRLLKQFPKENIQWNVSIDGELEMFEYVRWPGVWKDLYHNLMELSNSYDDVHIDILVNILNCENVLHMVDNVLLSDFGIDPEHIKFTPLTHPATLDVRNYPDNVLDNIMAETAAFMIPHGQHNQHSVMFMSALGLLTHMNDRTFAKDLDKTREFLLQLDTRRNLDYKTLGTYLNE